VTFSLGRHRTSHVGGRSPWAGTGTSPPWAGTNLPPGPASDLATATWARAKDLTFPYPACPTTTITLQGLAHTHNTTPTKPT